METTIPEAVLRELAAAGAITQTFAVAVGPAIRVEVQYGSARRTLCNKRGQPRLFASMHTLLNYLRELGLPRFEVDASEYSAGRLRKPRPDRSHALRRTRTRMRQVDLLEG